MRIIPILEHENYPIIMYLSLLSIFLVITFNMVNIATEISDDTHNKKTITGLAIDNENNETKTEKSSLIYEIILMIIISSIFIVIIIIIASILERFK